MQGVHPTIPSAVNSFFLYIPSKPSGKILELYKNCPSSRYLTCSIIFFVCLSPDLSANLDRVVRSTPFLPSVRP